MKTRRSRFIAIAAAAVTVAGATAASAVAHPHDRQGKRGAAASCEISDAERDAALTDAQKERLSKIQARMDERSDAEGLTARQQTRLDRIETRMVKRATSRAARSAPVLALFDGIDDTKALRQAAREAGGMRDLIEDTEGVTLESYRAAKREGRQAARQAVRDLCAGEGGEAAGETPTA